MTDRDAAVMIRAEPPVRRGATAEDDGGMLMQANSLAPTLLLSMPQMTDPNFARSVVLLCRHEPQGAMGLVVNRVTDTLASSVVLLDPPPQRDSGLLAWVGGPVEQQRGWLLLGYDPGTPDAMAVGHGLYLSASADVLRSLIEGREDGRTDHRFFFGYAGWGDGQLESELAASAWLTVDVTRALVFETPSERMWEAAIRTLGIDPYALQMTGGVH